MADRHPLLTLLCLISCKPCQIARPLISNTNVRFRGGICPENIPLDQIQNGRLKTIIDFNVCDILKTLPCQLHYYIKQNVQFQRGIHTGNFKSIKFKMADLCNY